jgi:integrase
VRNVAEAVTPPRTQARLMQTWDAEQARRFLEVAQQSGYGPIWVVFLATGMRRGEVLGLRWQDVDIARRTLSVQQTVGVLHGAPETKLPKTINSLCDVPVQEDVIAALRAHRCRQNVRRLALGAIWEDHDLVFPAANGRPINPNNLDRDFGRWVSRAGVLRIRIHDLRHTFVTLAIAAGANNKAISEVLGHAADIAITLRTYAHVLQQQRADVTDRMGAVLFGSVPANGQP